MYWVVGVEALQHQLPTVQRPVVRVGAGPEALEAMVMLPCSAALADGVGSKHPGSESALVRRTVAALP